MGRAWLRALPTATASRSANGRIGSSTGAVTWDFYRRPALKPKPHATSLRSFLNPGATRTGDKLVCDRNFEKALPAAVIRTERNPAARVPIHVPILEGEIASLGRAPLYAVHRGG